MFFSSPVKDADGTIVGTATLRINAEAIWALLDSAKLSPRATVALVDDGGVVIGPGKPELLWHSLGQLSDDAQNSTKSRFNLEKVDSLGLTNVAAELKRSGILVRTPSPGALAEEASVAYKDVADVVAVCERAGIARKVARLRPRVVIKG